MPLNYLHPTTMQVGVAPVRPHFFSPKRVWFSLCCTQKAQKWAFLFQRAGIQAQKMSFFLPITHFLHAKTTLGYPCLLLANPSPISYTIREYLNAPNLCPTNMQVGKWHHFRILGSGGMLLAPQSMVLSSYHPKSSKIDIINLTLKSHLIFPPGIAVTPGIFSPRIFFSWN